MEDTNWHPIEGFPGYSVNPSGQVMRNSTGRILVPRYNEYDVPYVGLMREWEQCNRSLPLIVARTFLEPPSDIFNTPIQLDGDKTNCRVENLMWRPWWYAVRYKQQFKNPYEHPIKQPVKAVNEKEKFPNSLAAAKRYGLLEKEVVESILHNTRAWPTYQVFERVKMK